MGKLILSKLTEQKNSNRIDNFLASPIEKIIEWTEGENIIIEPNQDKSKVVFRRVPDANNGGGSVNILFDKPLECTTKNIDNANTNAFITADEYSSQSKEYLNYIYDNFDKTDYNNRLRLLISQIPSGVTPVIKNQVDPVNLILYRYNSAG